MNTIEKALAKKHANKKVSEKPEESIITTHSPLSEQQEVQIVDTEIKKSSTHITPEKNNAAMDSKATLTIDKESLAQRGFLIENGTRSSIKDEFRQIKRKLLNNAFGLASKKLNHSNLVMISSSIPNEGKTFVAINLALSIALEQDKTVLLIDSDVLRPSINRELGFDEQPGIIEYLLGNQNNIGDLIYNTNIEKLKVMPAGKPHHLSNELLASDRMTLLANELADRYPDRIVIFDCPPLIGVSETVVLSELMGQALLVVEENKTLITDIERATEQLNEDLALGLVLNKSVRTHQDLYGYYGYGYGQKK